MHNDVTSTAVDSPRIPWWHVGTATMHYTLNLCGFKFVTQNDHLFIIVLNLQVWISPIYLGKISNAQFGKISTLLDTLLVS